MRLPLSMSVCCTLILVGVTVSCGGTPSAADRITVFAASSLTDVMTAVGEAWQGEGGSPVVFSFAASSTLARQAGAGAPANVILLAGGEWMAILDENGTIVRHSRIRPVSNQLVLIGPAGSADSTTFDPSFRLPAGGRLAVGDPSHVPAGQYARQTLERIGRWMEFEPHLATADNVRGALALVERGDAPLGIVYRTDARVTDRVRVLSVIPDSLHDPIVYEAAVVAGHQTQASVAFLAFLRSATARRVFHEAGFNVPETS